MIRKQIYLTEAMNDTLNRIAESRGVPQAEVIREGLAKYLTDHQSQDDLWEQLKQKMLSSSYSDLEQDRSKLYEERIRSKEEAADE